jgi:hypothetical protein
MLVPEVIVLGLLDGLLPRRIENLRAVNDHVMNRRTGRLRGDDRLDQTGSRLRERPSIAAGLRMHQDDRGPDLVEQSRKSIDVHLRLKTAVKHSGHI